MSKLSYTDIKNSFLLNIGSTGSTDTTLINQFKINLGQRYQQILAEMGSYITSAPKTGNTAVNTQFYSYPAGIIRGDTCTVTVGSFKNVLSPIYSQTQWDLFNAIQIQPTAYPQFIFYRHNDFGIWPTPQGIYPYTFNVFMRDRNLTIEDYTTGTITATNNSASIVGVGTTFTKAMVGRWLQVTSEVYGAGYWYKISAYTDANTITLANNYEGDTVIGASYRVCECPDIPDEGHVLLVDGVTADFYAGQRSDIEKATWFNNKFWTGDGNNSNRDRGSDKNSAGLLGLANAYSGRDDKRIIVERPSRYTPASKAWTQSII